MTTFQKYLIAIGAVLGLASAAHAQPIILTYPAVESWAASASSNTTDQSCLIIKYRGVTAGQATVEVAAGGDMTLKIATVADATIGSPNLDGVFDLSTPAAAVDTMGELVSLINSTGSNWVAVLTGCLAADLTNNTITTISATEANGPKGVALTHDGAVASATSIFSAQVALLPYDCNTNIQCFVSGGVVGSPTGSTKVNRDPFKSNQTFVQHIREKITSSGTVALLEVIAVRRTYDTLGKVSDVARSLYAETGAATTVEKVVNLHNGPIVTGVGEMVIVRQRTATDLSAAQIAGSAYSVVRK